MDKIYVLKKKKLMYGPYTIKAVKEKGLRPSDMVWFQGLEDWTPVLNVEYLAKFIISDKTHHVRKKSLIEKVFSFLN
jgi:hypothetical protein